MVSEWAGEAARGVRSLFQGVGAGLSDAELLRRFVARGETSASAFEVLVARHGPAVWGVCRRTLTDPADALDAFQATFLVLVQKAGSVRVDDSLGPWLHGVSTRIARRARANLARRRAREQTNAEALERVATEAGPIDDLRAVLDHELARLPSRYRSPLMLCYLEGLTHEEAAARLACPVGTVRSRLARGRGLLQSRLVRKGFAPSAVTAVLAFEARPALAGIAASLIASTLKLAFSPSATKTVPFALAAEFGRSMLLAKLGRGTAMVALLLATAGISLALMRKPAQKKDDDAPLPVLTVAQLVSKIEDAQQGYAKGLIETEYEEELVSNRWKLFSDRMDETPLPPGFPERPQRKAKELTKPKYNKVPGKTSYSSDGLRWKASYYQVMGDEFADGPPEQPRPYDKWVAGYDGKTHYKGDGSLSSINFPEYEPNADKLTTPALFWQDQRDRKSILDEVLVPGAIITQQTIDGFRCYVVRSSGEDGQEAREAVISPRQSYLPLTMTRTVGGQTELSAKLLDLRKLPDGRWYPGRLIVEKRFKAAGSDRLILESRRETRIINFKPNYAFQPGDFAFAILPNADVLDDRTGLFYRNDPWWPELRDFLRKEYDWPRTDLSSLDSLISPDPTLEGREAAPLSVSRWLRGDPVTWETLRGKVVLVVFTQPGDPALLPALRRLREAYGPKDFEVVEVMPSTTNGDWAAGYLDEYDVDHPVLQDDPLEGQYGATSAAFGAGRPFEPERIDPNNPPTERRAAYLIDAKGKVHAIPKAGWSKRLVEQLQVAGSKTAKPLSPADNLGWLDRRNFRLQNAWQGWTMTAPATGRFVGKVVDGQGKPVVGAKIRCQLFASVLGGWKRIVDLTASRSVEATTGPDGSFVIEKLCKGNYRLELEADGLANSLREAMIGPALGDINLKLVLAQENTVTGTILDETGQPIAGARAELFDRSYEAGPDKMKSQVELAKNAVADANGQFRFEALREGRYSLRVSAEGFTGQTHVWVPAGASGLEFRLKRDRAEK